MGRSRPVATFGKAATEIHFASEAVADFGWGNFLFAGFLFELNVRTSAAGTRSGRFGMIAVRSCCRPTLNPPRH
jgi:hypothetical protein